MKTNLDSLMTNFPGGVLKRVNLPDWNCEARQKYSVDFVPNVRVFDRQGTPIGQPTADLGIIEQNISTAKGS